MNDAESTSPVSGARQAFEQLLALSGAVFSEIENRRVVTHFGDASTEYDAIAHGVAVIDLGCRSRIEVSGADRAAFLHNLCSNEIRKLPAGSGCEAFFLNVPGKILAHVLALSRAETLLLESVAGADTFLLEHLERYHIREAIELHDRQASWGELFLAGPKAREVLTQLAGNQVPESHLTGAELTLAGASISAWRIALGPLEGLLLFADAPQVADLWQRLASAGARPAGSQALETARIEAGWPLHGRDISDKNLPQEVARDARTINFTKGCYLGQETVARIDALGHVNKLLVGVRFDGQEVPPHGSPLTRDGQPVGETLSATFSPRQKSPLALAYVRRGSHAPGVRLESPFGPAEVIAWDA